MQVKGLKFDTGSDKLEWSLIPWNALGEVVKVLMYGKKKYTQTLDDGTVVSGADNWKLVDNAKERYWNAAMRHLIAIREGEKHDPETGLHHGAHACCDILFALWFDLEVD